MRRRRETQTPIFNETLHITQEEHKTRNSLLWGFVNALGLSVLLYDALNTCDLYSSSIVYLEWFLIVVLFLNILYHFGSYLRVTFYLEPVTLTTQQRTLMGVPESDPHFRVVSPSADTTSASVSPYSDMLTSTPMNMSAVSWRSSASNDSFTSPNCTMSSPSWVYYKGSPGANSPYNRSHHSTAGTNISSVEFIDNESSLSQYLRDYDSFEKTASVGQSMEQPTNLLSSFWNHPSTRTSSEVPATLRRCTYQLASPTSLPAPGLPKDETGSTSSSFLQNQDVWRRVKVNPNVLIQWNANLRMWISQTILERLVNEIDAVDEALQRYALADVKVGLVGLERLKKTAQILQVSQNIPTLMSLVPFLELTSNQEYLVTRIRELAKGGCMSEFRWNAGGSFHNKDWEEHLPTDSAIVMHLFATYLDSQLPPLPQNPDGRPFTAQHFAKIPDKPSQNKNTLAIYQVQINPPHYVLLDGEDKVEVPKGRNNMFHTLLLFLHQINTKEHGMLGRVNLGPSGINLLWVIQT